MKNRLVKALTNPNYFNCILLSICTFFIAFSQITTNRLFEPGYLSFFAFIFLGFVSSILVFPWILKIRKIKISLVDIALLIFLFILATRWILTPNNTIYSKGSIIIALITIYLYIRSVLKIDIIHKSIVIAGGVQIITVVLQLTGLIENTNKNFIFGGTLGNPNVLAMIFAFTIFSAISLLKQNNIHKVEEILLKAFIVSAIVVIVATQCRTALLGLVVTGAYFLITSLSIINSTRVKSLLISAFAISVVIFVFLIYHKSGSLLGRLLIWESSLNVLIDKPFWGHGTGTFQIVYPQGQINVFENPSKLLLYHNVAGTPYWAYNDAVEFFIEGGVFLALAYYFLFSAILLRWKYAINYKHGEIDFGYVPIVLFFLFGSVNFAFAAWPLLLLFVLYLASCKSLHSKSYTVEFTFTHTGCVVGIMLIVGCSLATIKGFNQLEFQQKLLNINKMSNANNELFYNKHSKSHSNYLPFVFNNAHRLIANGKEDEGIAVLQKANSFFNSYDTNLQLADAYLAANDLSNAVLHYEKACKILPNRIAPYYIRLLIYSYQKEYDKVKNIKKYIHDNYFKGDNQYINHIKSQVSEYDPFEQ